MRKSTIFNRALFIDSIGSLSLQNVVFSVEFNYSYKPLVLIAEGEVTLYIALRCLYEDGRAGKLGDEFRKETELSDTLAVSVEYVHEEKCDACDRHSGLLYEQTRHDLLLAMQAYKIIELHSYAPHGYNFEVNQFGFRDNELFKLVKSKLSKRPNGEKELVTMLDYLNIGLPEKRRKGAIVYCYSTKDGKLLESFESITAAAEAKHCKYTNIIGACDGKNLTAGGFAWSRHKYEQLPAFVCNEEEAARRYSGKRGRLGKYIYKFDALTGKLVGEYDTIIEASMGNNIDSAEIADACKAGLLNPIILLGRYIFTDENPGGRDNIESISPEELRNINKNNSIRRTQIKEQRKQEAFAKRQEKQAEMYNKAKERERVWAKKRVYHKYGRPQDNENQSPKPNFLKPDKDK